jgi:hypothetical protein
MKNSENSFAVYCGETVEILDLDADARGNAVLIRFEDGREDTVPMTVIDFLD